MKKGKKKEKRGLCPPQALVTWAGVTPLEPEHLGPQAGPSWAEGVGRHAGPRALPDRPSARAAVSDARGGPSCRVQASCPHRKGRPQGCRSSGQSPGLHSSAGGVPTSSLLPEDPLNPRMTAPSPDCCCRNGEVFGGQRVRERSQETQPWVFPLTYSL